MGNIYIGENPPPGMAVIYSLRETVDGPRRYIGSTSKNLHVRAHKHKMMQRFPVMVVELIVPVERQKRHEQEMINACRAEGVDIVNQRNPVPQCGTVGGYEKHRRSGEIICADCNEALRAHVQKRDGRKPFQPAVCGTAGGYDRHSRNGEKSCVPCLAALRKQRQERLGRKPRSTPQCGTNDSARTLTATFAGSAA